MYFTIYKITNQINGKFYIGKHRTDDINDNYMGSGKLLKKAIKKYGIENFIKEYIGIFDSEKKMNLAEKILVIIDKEVCYNLCPGGYGGWGYINSKNLNNSKNQCSLGGKITASKGGGFLKRKHTNQTKKYISLKKKGNKHFFGKKHSEETKKIMSEKAKINNIGKNNSQYGTCWITNGVENKKIKKTDIEIWINLGYSKGRIIKKYPVSI